MLDCLFCKIINNEIPASKVYEDDLILAFKDIFPKAPVHILVVPKKHIQSLNELKDCDENLISHLTLSIPKIAKLVNLENGFKTIINTGKGGGQEIFHLHYHILGTPIRTTFDKN